MLQPFRLTLLLFLPVVMLVPAVLYLLTLQKALARCSDQARTTSPGSVWLMLVPLFNLVYQFIVVSNIAKSLANEFSRRGITTTDREPGKSIGIAMCVLNVCAIIPILGIAAGFAGLVCWIIYWVKVAGFSGMIAVPFSPAQHAQSAT